MNYAMEIPEALHICPGCRALASGPELCAACRQRDELAAYLDARKRGNGLFSRLPRVQAQPVQPEEPKWLALLGSAFCATYLLLVLFCLGWVVFRVVEWFAR